MSAAPAVGLVSAFNELVEISRARGTLFIFHGWAPNPPPEHGASKLMKYVLLGSDMEPVAVYWLWRENGEQDWNLVPPTHWAPINAAREWRKKFTIEYGQEEPYLCFLREILSKLEQPAP